MDIAVGFSQIFSSVVQLWGVVYTTGLLLWNWFSTPLADSADSELVDFLGDFALYTPFELMLGPAILLILILALVKFLFVRF